MNYLPLIVLYIVVFGIAAYEDIKKRTVSNIYYISLISVTLLYKLVFKILDIKELFFSVIVIICIAEILFNFNVLGGGDSKLLFALSFGLGFDFSKIFILVYLIGILITALIYVPIATKKDVKKIPFVPVMFIWLFTALLFI